MPVTYEGSTGWVALLREARGELDESIRLRRDEILPLALTTGIVRVLLIESANLAFVLARRNRPMDRSDARRLVQNVLAEQNALGAKEIEYIRGLQRTHDLAWDQSRQRNRSIHHVGPINPLRTPERRSQHS